MCPSIKDETSAASVRFNVLHFMVTVLLCVQYIKHFLFTGPGHSVMVSAVACSYLFSSDRPRRSVSHICHANTKQPCSSCSKAFNLLQVRKYHGLLIIITASHMLCFVRRPERFRHTNTRYVYPRHRRRAAARSG